MMKTDRKEIRKLVRQGLEAGKSKEEVFIEIYQGYKDPRLHREIAETVQYIPDKQRLGKYGIYNTLFLLLLIVTDIALGLTAHYMELVIPVILTVLVALRLTKYYQWIAFLGVIMFISLIAMLFTETLRPQQNLILTVGGYVIVSALFIIFGFYYPKFLTPDYTILEETVRDAEGKEIIRKRIVFR